jgi:MFS family permease
MLGIFFLYFIGKYFYKLAEEFKKNKWLFAILGILVYYIGTFIGGVILGILDELIGIGFDWDNTLALGLIALPFGIGVAYLFYFILKKEWEKSFVFAEDEIQDIGKHLE